MWMGRHIHVWYKYGSDRLVANFKCWKIWQNCI